MNLKNLVMWAVIVFLTIGLYNMFKNPQGTITQKNNIIFSEFLSEVDNGRVVQVEIQGNNIKGIMSNGEKFTTYSPNDPNLIEKLSDKGVSISASPLEEKMPSLLGVLLSWFPMLLLIAVWIFFMRQMQGGKGGAMGFGRSKAKMMNELKGKVTFNDVAGVEEAKEEVELEKNGRVKSREILERNRMGTDGKYRIFAEAVDRAVLKCNPIKNLPTKTYENWSTMILRFNPEGMMVGE